MFSQFPKKRNGLPPAYREIYDAHFRNNRSGGTPASRLSKTMEGWMHRRVAADVKKKDSPLSTLEIGAGMLSQLEYELNAFPYDIVEPSPGLYQNAKGLSRIRDRFSDISEIDLGLKYDRITAVAAFEHILDLPEVVAKCCLLLKESGCLRVAIPNEGRRLWRFCTMISTGLEFRLRYGLDYRALMEYEHVNAADEIEAVLRYFFNKIESSFLGVGKSFSLYRFYRCADQDTEKAAKFIKEKIKKLKEPWFQPRLNQRGRQGGVGARINLFPPMTE
jgi:hypothetical protein